MSDEATPESQPDVLASDGFPEAASSAVPQHDTTAPTDWSAMKMSSVAASIEAIDDFESRQLESERCPPTVLKSEIAQGKFGVLHLALDEFGREVALKMVQPAMLHEPLALRQFHVEAEITASLQELRSVLPIHQRGEHDGQPWYTMRLARGGTLSSAVARSKLATSNEATVRDLLRGLIDVCRAVDFAHGQGIVHGDISPNNVVLGNDGSLYLIDWGLARWGAHFIPEHHRTDGLKAGFMSSQGAVRSNDYLGGGTPGFQAPELATGPITHAVDLYSLGTLLVFVATGERPDSKQAQTAIARQPKKLRAILRKAIAVEVAERYSSAEQIALDVQGYLEDGPVSAAPETRWDRAAKWGYKHRAWLTSVLVLIAVAVGSYVGLQAEMLTQLQTETAQTFASYDRYVAAVMSDEMLKEPRFQALRKQLLKEAELFYVARLGPTGPVEKRAFNFEERRRIQKSLVRLGEIQRETVSPYRALESLEPALAMLHELSHQSPENPSLEEEAIKLEAQVGQLLVAANRVDVGLAKSKAALDHAKLFAKEHPTHANTDLMIEVQRSLVSSLFNSAHGDSYESMMRRALDEAAILRELAQQAFDQSPTDARRLGLAKAINSVALTRHKTRHVVPAGLSREEQEALQTRSGEAIIALYDEALAMLAPLKKSTFNLDVVERTEAGMCSNQGMTFSGIRRLDDAIRVHRRGLELRKAIAERNRLVYEDQRWLAVNSANLADAISSSPDFEFREQEIEPRTFALKTLIRVMELAPDVVDFKAMYAIHCMRLGFLHHLRGRNTEAVAAIRDGMRFFPPLEQAEPHNRGQTYQVAISYILLADAESDTSQRAHWESKAAAALRTIVAGDMTPFDTNPSWKATASMFDRFLEHPEFAALKAIRRGTNY